MFNIQTNQIIDELRSTSIRRVFRLTDNQKRQAQQNFEDFFVIFCNLENELETKYGDTYHISEEFIPFNNIIESLQCQYSRAIFLCMRCGKAVSIRQLKTDTKTSRRYHKCKDDEQGYGIYSNWLRIYATLVRNDAVIQFLQQKNQVIQSDLQTS